MKHVVPHDLGQEKAKKVAEAALLSYKDKFPKYDPQTTWVNERRAEISFTVKGFSLRGTVEVNPTSIELELEVPFLLKPFRGTALGIIEQEIAGWIKKAKAGEV